MKRIVTREVFVKMFENLEYRKKLDQIILNFFGLETNIKESNSEIINNKVILNFIVFLNTEYLLKIVVIDKQKIFKESKTFYLNISYREVSKHHELLMPYYWEIYSPYCLNNPKKENKLLLLAGIFSCKRKEEVKKILTGLEIFKKTELNNLLNKLSKKIN